MCNLPVGCTPLRMRVGFVGAACAMTPRLDWTGRAPGGTCLFPHCTLFSRRWPPGRCGLLGRPREPSGAWACRCRSARGTYSEPITQAEGRAVDKTQLLVL